MVEEFVKLNSLDETIESIYNAMLIENWETVRSETHKLKSPAG
jgi:hypothetical protein